MSIKDYPEIFRQDHLPLHGETSLDSEVVGYPTPEIAEIIEKLYKSELPEAERKEVSFERNSLAAKLTESELYILERFAGNVVGRDRCKIIVLYGCGSCRLGGGCHVEGGYIRWGNRVHTECGWQCWYCATDGC